MVRLTFTDQDLDFRGASSTACGHLVTPFCWEISPEYDFWLVVWNIFVFPYIGNVIIPTDALIFFRGVGIPPTRLALTCKIRPGSHLQMELFRHQKRLNLQVMWDAQVAGWWFFLDFFGWLDCSVSCFPIFSPLEQDQDAHGYGDTFKVWQRVPRLTGPCPDLLASAILEPLGPENVGAWWAQENEGWAWLSHNSMRMLPVQVSTCGGAVALEQK